MSDPRKPKRPDGPAGDSWAICRGCARGAQHARDIRHAKNCRGRDVFVVVDFDMPDALPSHDLKGSTLRRISEGLHRYRQRRT